MLFRLYCVMFILASCLGCGTIHNLDEERKPYGGVVHDCLWTVHGNWLFVGPEVPAPLGLIDIPFSLVGDTVTLPITMYSSLNERFLFEKQYEQLQERLRRSRIPKTPPQGQYEP
jgi:uncharacterized protein YceK